MKTILSAFFFSWMKADINFFETLSIVDWVFETFALITGEECCQNPKEIVKCSLVISAMCFKFSPWSLPRRKTMVLGKAVGVNKVTNWENKDRLNLAFTIWLPKVYVAVLQQLLSLARLQFAFSQWVELQYLNYTWWWNSKWKKFCQHWKTVKSNFFGKNQLYALSRMLVQMG